MRTWRIVSLVPVLLLMASAACAAQAPSRNAPGATAPAAAVERFMRLVSAKDYAQMGYVFGTREGAVIQRDPEAQVERRMYAIASILQHSRFVIRDEAQIPGRTGEAVRFTVDVENGGMKSQVPFVVVRDKGGRWFVEQIDLEKVTRRQ